MSRTIRPTSTCTLPIDFSRIRGDRASAYLSRHGGVGFPVLSADASTSKQGSACAGPSSFPAQRGATSSCIAPSPPANITDELIRLFPGFSGTRDSLSSRDMSRSNNGGKTDRQEPMASASCASSSASFIGAALPDPRGIHAASPARGIVAAHAVGVPSSSPRGRSLPALPAWRRAAARRPCRGDVQRRADPVMPTSRPWPSRAIAWPAARGGDFWRRRRSRATSNDRLSGRDGSDRVTRLDWSAAAARTVIALPVEGGEQPVFGGTHFSASIFGSAQPRSGANIMARFAKDAEVSTAHMARQPGLAQSLQIEIVHPGMAEAGHPQRVRRGVRLVFQH